MRLSERVKSILEKAGVRYGEIYDLESQSEYALERAERCDPRAIIHLRPLIFTYRRISDKLDEARKKGLISLEEWNEAGSAVYKIIDDTEKKVIESLDVCIRR